MCIPFILFVLFGLLCFAIIIVLHLLLVVGHLFTYHCITIQLHIVIALFYKSLFHLYHRKVDLSGPVCCSRSLLCLFGIL